MIQCYSSLASVAGNRMISVYHIPLISEPKISLFNRTSSSGGLSIVFTERQKCQNSWKKLNAGKNWICYIVANLSFLLKVVSSQSKINENWVIFRKLNKESGYRMQLYFLIIWRFAKAIGHTHSKILVHVSKVKCLFYTFCAGLTYWVKIQGYK